MLCCVSVLLTCYGNGLMKVAVTPVLFTVNT